MLSLMLIAVTMPPNAPPAAVIQNITTSVINAVMGQKQLIFLLLFFLLSKTIKAKTHPSAWQCSYRQRIK
jgi:hypothetical protein